MDYELAKELSDAGFPHLQRREKHQSGFILVDKNNKHTNSLDLPLDSALEGYEVIPTLSELIEACGEEFYSLTKNPLSPNLWDASRIKDSRGAHRTILAHTPEEAVARLYIALNK